jgi:hypothetical protein
MGCGKLSHIFTGEVGAALLEQVGNDKAFPSKYSGRKKFILCPMQIGAASQP